MLSNQDNTRCIIGPDDSDNDISISSSERSEEEQNRTEEQD